ncbi:hypothetical protein [Dongshaea marina]|uniref:hypothetical protein n=1 Tax=Dongshaea marina TaxID=2047966 RepID=UPI000D3EC31A|nr:hypothetical protein [Dongshaea marina]
MAIEIINWINLGFGFFAILYLSINFMGWIEQLWCDMGESASNQSPARGVLEYSAFYIGVIFLTALLWWIYFSWLEQLSGMEFFDL